MTKQQRAMRLGGAVAAVLVGVLAGPAAAQDPTVAPALTYADGGRTVSGAGRTLSASQVDGLDPAGQAVTVTGSGYDDFKGVYVSLCVIPPTHHPPTPCGGGVDRTGESTASAWVSSNPPDYAAGLTQPYGPGGSFTVALSVSPGINEALDCFSVRCAIVTRNDHVRGSDRSQDLFLPVTFGAPATPGPADPSPPPAVATTVATTTTTVAMTTTTVATTTTTVSSPTMEVRSDGAGGAGGAAMAAGVGGGVLVLGAGVLGARQLRSRRGAGGFGS